MNKEILEKVIISLEDDGWIIPDECINIIQGAIEHYILICKSKEHNEVGK